MLEHLQIYTLHASGVSSLRMSSDYGEIEDWDGGAEEELLAIERTTSLPSPKNNTNDYTGAAAILRQTHHLDVYIEGAAPVASTSTLPDRESKESLLATALNSLEEVEEPRRSLW